MQLLHKHRLNRHQYSKLSYEMETPKLYNNTTEKVVDGLKADLQSGSRLSIAAASFSIYAYQALKEELENIAELRFIFTAPTFSKSNTSKQKREFFISARSLRFVCATNSLKKPSQESVLSGFAERLASNQISPTVLSMVI